MEGSYREDCWLQTGPAPPTGPRPVPLSLGPATTPHAPQAASPGQVPSFCAETVGGFFSLATLTFPNLLHTGSILSFRNFFFFFLKRLTREKTRPWYVLQKDLLP